MIFIWNALIRIRMIYNDYMMFRKEIKFIINLDLSEFKRYFICISIIFTCPFYLNSGTGTLKLLGRISKEILCCIELHKTQRKLLSKNPRWGLNKEGKNFCFISSVLIMDLLIDSLQVYILKWMCMLSITIQISNLWVFVCNGHHKKNKWLTITYVSDVSSKTKHKLRISLGYWMDFVKSWMVGNQSSLEI